MSYDLGTAHGKITLDYDGKHGVRQAEEDVDKLERKAKTGDKSLSKLGTTLKGLGKGAKIGAMASAIGIAAVQAANLGIQLLGIIPSLVSIASLSAALPGLYVGLAATIGLLKAAFQGVGDAVKAAFDPTKAAKFDKAIKNLAPEAQTFARAVKAAVPAIKGFQQEIQNAFFRASALAGQVPKLVRAMGQLQPMAVGLTSDFGGLARKLVDFGLSQDSVTFVSDAMQVLRAAVSGAGGPLVKLLTGLRDVGGVGLPLMLQLTDSVNTLAAAFGTWLSQISSDGRLQAWIDTALSTLKTLGAIVKNVFTILMTLITAASNTGGGLLNTLALITGQLAAFLSTAEGTTAITSIFSAISAVAKQLSPIITTLVGVIAKALGPALQQIATVIGPVLLQTVQALAPAFGPLVAAAANLLTAIAPLVPPIAQLVALLAGVLTNAVNALVAELGPLINILAQGLSQAFTHLTPLIGAMAQGLPVAAEAGAALAKAFAPLIPVIVDLADTLASSLLDVMPQLIDAAHQIIPIFVNFASVMSKNLASGLKLVVQFLPIFIKALVVILPILAQVALFGLRVTTFLMNLPRFASEAGNAILSFGKSLISGIGDALKIAYNFVLSIGSAVINWFTQLPGRILGAIKALPGLIGNFIKAWLNGVATVVGFEIGLIVGFFTKLLPRIFNAIVNLPTVIGNLISQAMTAAKNFVSSAINAIVTFFHNLPGRAKAAISSLGSAIVSIARSAWASFRSAVVNGVNSAINFVTNLPKRMKAALGNLGSLLSSSGRSVIQGLINGINSMIDKVIGLVQGLADRVKGAFNRALAIFSPSREFFASGVNIGKGLIAGLKDQLSSVAQAGQLLASTVIQPTVNLPSVASAASTSVGMNALPARSVAALTQGRTFGPYKLELDGGVVTQFVIDAVTGNPKVVSKAATEGSRQESWTGSGRKAR